MADGTAPDRNLALELVRVTEAAALGCGRWIGRGDKNAADQAAVDAMRAMLDTVSMSGVVVIGEGEKDEAPMLYNGEEVGNGQGPEVDVAVDPLEGTRLTSVGQPNAIAVIALDRERNQPIVDGIREAGAKVNLITDGDVAPAIAAARQGTGVDLMMGIGGTPEGVIAAAAVKCLGGVVLRRPWPRNDDERQQLVDAGYDPDRVLTTDDLVGGDNVFVAATGVTDGALLRGVRYTRGGATTDSIVMRSRSGTVRRVEAQHALDKLERFSGREYR